ARAAVSVPASARVSAFAVTHIDAADLPAVRNVLEMLAGRVSGLGLSSVATRIGGGQPDVVMREDALPQGEIPLIVIDGVVADNGTMGLEPADVATIDVYRGAAASAEFGARAGAGVISITTRQASAGPGWSFGFRTLAGAADLGSDLAPARNTMLLTDPSGSRLCVAAAGAPLCSATVDWAAEAARINNFAADTAATPAQFPVSFGPTPSAALANLYQANAWPGPAYRPFGQGLI